jgi:hypothetical protein
MYRTPGDPGRVNRYRTLPRPRFVADLANTCGVAAVRVWVGVASREGTSLVVAPARSLRLAERVPSCPPHGDDDARRARRGHGVPGDRPDWHVLWVRAANWNVPPRLMRAGRSRRVGRSVAVAAPVPDQESVGRLLDGDQLQHRLRGTGSDRSADRPPGLHRVCDDLRLHRALPHPRANGGEPGSRHGCLRRAGRGARR